VIVYGALRRYLRRLRLVSRGWAGAAAAAWVASVAFFGWCRFLAKTADTG
jgi:hypothetical protein